MSPNIIEFRNLPQDYIWCDYQQLFSKFGTVTKLFLDPKGAFGKVYFDTNEAAAAVFEELNGRPPLNLLLSEPIIGDYNQKYINSTVLTPNMNKLDYRSKYEVEGCVQNYEYVDIFGRLVSTFEGEDGEIYVSLSELKKSGFELFQSGSIPRPGQIPSFDEQLRCQFEMYLKMKATKFLSTHKFTMPNDYVDSIINKETNHYFENSGARSVKMDARGLIKISASPITPLIDHPYTNRKRMSLDMDEAKSFGTGRFNRNEYQNPRASMSAIHETNNYAGRSVDRWNQRNNSGDSKSRSFGRFSDSYQRFSMEEPITNSYAKSKQMNSFIRNEQDMNTVLTKHKPHMNALLPSSSNNNGDSVKRAIRRPYNSITETHSNYQQPNIDQNMINFDNDDNQSIASSGQPSDCGDTKPLPRPALIRNTPQKEYNGTDHIQVKEEIIDTPSPAPAQKRRVSFVEDTIVHPETNLASAITQEVVKCTESDSNRDATDLGTDKTPCLKSSQPVADSFTTPEEIVSTKNVSNSSSNCKDANISLIQSNDLKIPVAPTRQSVVELATADTGIFECIDIIDENTFIAFVFPNEFSAQLCDLESISDEVKPNPNFKPSIGDLLAVLNGKDYVRGTVIDIVDGKYNCALVDFGTTILTSDICLLPDRFKAIPEFTCLCKADNKVLHDIAANGSSNMSVTIIAPGKLMLKIESSEKEHEIVASRWNPLDTIPLAACKKTVKVMDAPVTEKAIETAPVVKKPVLEPAYKLQQPTYKLKDNDIVIITAEEHGFLLVRTKECNALLKQVNQELSSLKATHFDKLPEINQLAVASFNDDGHYRVVIKSVTNSNAIVEYIDYGNSDCVPLKKLMHISEKLAKMENTLIKIRLNGFIDTKFSEVALGMLADCSLKKEKFTAIRSGKENEYDLLYADQTSLTNKLKLLDKPSPVQLEVVQKPKTPQQPVAAPPTPAPATSTAPAIVTLSHLPPSKFKMGTNEVMCMYTGDLKEGNISFCLSTAETTESLTEVQLKIMEYATKISGSYNPEVDEICLAKFADEWYRACVLDKDAKGYSVYYIDFGNSHVVPATEICKIPTELTKIQPLASLCILKGVMTEGADIIQAPLLSKMQEDLQENETYTIDVVENIEGYLIITIPTLFKSWIEQGLL